MTFGWLHDIRAVNVDSLNQAWLSYWYMNFQQTTNVLCVGAVSHIPGSDARFGMRRVALDQEPLKVIAGFSKPIAFSGHQLVTAEELYLLT